MGLLEIGMGAKNVSFSTSTLEIPRGLAPPIHSSYHKISILKLTSLESIHAHFLYYDFLFRSPPWQWH